MIDDSVNISHKTWTRAADVICKTGYMDGAADGQAATFQSSFDTGYEQGINFGMQLGLKESLMSFQHEHQPSTALMDSQKINCHICIDSTLLKDNVVNLYNKQKEVNDKYLRNLDSYKIKDGSYTVMFIFFCTYFPLKWEHNRLGLFIETGTQQK